MKQPQPSLESLCSEQKQLNEIFKPVFYRINKPEEKQEFNTLLSLPGIMVSDYIFDQLRELVKIKNPSVKFSSEELDRATKNYISEKNLDEYGVWVHYPWSNRLAHILDEEEFVEVRTSRNQYKITPEERDILGKKKIGVIGLSVGQSVSVTLAMERICGELRLADFDILELTNLNRIRTGVHNLGLHKVYSVAREISEIDPYIKVVCFPQGLNEKNMDEFFTGGGNLDLLVEESDGFDIKILSRHKARALKIPVIMEASDRCAVDVERFDLEPNRSILHGLVDHLDIETLKTLKTNEEKIPYMLDVIGIETSSLRLKASMLEIEQTITTWPQLASAVTMGGGITADVSRRMLLNQYTESGRYHVDIEELIGNRVKKEEANKEELIHHAPLNLDEFQKLIPINQQPSLHLQKHEVEKIVEAACKAPSGGNAQPWRWVYKNNKLYLFNAFDSNGQFLGYGNLASCVGLGAAIENLILQAAEMNLETHVKTFPDEKLKNLVGIFEFSKSEKLSAKNKTRADAINLRLTNRMLGTRKNIEQNLLDKMMNAAKETEGTTLKFFTEPEQLDAIADVLGELEKIRLIEKWGHKDFLNEMRWTKEENESTRDGVDFRTLDLSNSERIGMHMSKDARLINMLREWEGGGAFKKLTKKSIAAAGAVGMITMHGNKQEHFLVGGRVLQRVWLEANAHGVSLQPTAASVFLFARFLQGGGKGLSAEACKQLGTLRPIFEKVFSVPQNRHEIFMFRLCIAREP